MEFIKKNKLSLLVLFFMLIIGITASILISSLLSDTYAVAYGNRLLGIEKFNINNEILKEKANTFASSNDVTVTSSLKGKLINFIIDVKDMSLEDSYLLAASLLNEFSEEELSFFDIQIFLIGEGEDYPKIGYKHETSKILKWSN